MTYPFVHARFDYGTRKAQVLAFLVHFAEGGGTVGYLANQPARGVSVHYVIEDNGRTVQMLDETHASGSVDPTKIRTTNDADGFYGVSAAVAVLGKYARDPNSAVISLEIEGFALQGPNTAQKAALVALVDDVRHRYPAIGLLGHRDFADYKPCPGRLIPWTAIGGHGPQEVDMPYEFKVERWKRNADGVLITTVGAPKKADGTVDYTSRLALLSGSDGARRLDAVSRASITPVTAALDDTFYAALTAYAIPDSATAVNAALDYVAGPATAVITAIHEARPR